MKVRSNWPQEKLPSKSPALLGLIEYSDNFSETPGSLWQYNRDDQNDNITQSKSFQFKLKMTGKTPASGKTKDVKTEMPLKYLNLILTWYENCIISPATGATKFKIADAKSYVLVVTLSLKIMENYCNN